MFNRVASTSLSLPSPNENAINTTQQAESPLVPSPSVSPAPRQSQELRRSVSEENAANAHLLGPLSALEFKEAIQLYVDNETYDIAHNTYENSLLSTDGQETHAKNQIAVFSNILALKAAYSSKPDQFRTTLREQLPELVGNLVANGDIDLSIYREKGDGIHGYSKFLLFTNPDANDKFCLQLFAFAPGQKTPIHDHPCECMSMVVQGELSERLYAVEEHNDANAPWIARKTHKNPRPAGSMARFDSDTLDIPHSIKNRANPDSLAVRLDAANDPEHPVSLHLQPTPVAISIHFYEDMDGGGSETPLVTNRRTELAEQRKGVAAVGRLYQDAKHYALARPAEQG